MSFFRPTSLLIATTFFVLMGVFGVAPEVNAGGYPGSCIDDQGAFIDGCDDGPEVVIITLTASPETIIQGQSSTLSLTVNFSGNGTCDTNIPSGSGTGTNPQTGAQEFVVYPTVTTAYYYTCTAYSGTSGSGGATVTVNAATTDLYAGNTTTGGVSLGTPASFSSAVTNGGNSTATNFPNSFQISGIGYVAAQTHTLGAGGSTAISASYNFASPGNYSVRACADTNTSGAGAYSESNEANNCGAWNTVSVVAPDLTASGLSPTTGTAGSATTITGTISNSGPTSAGVSTSALRIYNSGGTLIETSPYATPGIIPGGSAVASFSYTFPSAGNYTMSMCADWGSVVTESNEGNNCGPTTGITIGNAPAPDLTASNLGPGSAVIGISATFQGRVNNVGNATATNIPNIFQICDNNCATLNAVIPGTTIASVGAGANDSGVTGAYTFATPGTYYYRMCADTNTSWAGTNAESNESNNCDNWSTVTVTAPDLTATVPGAISGTAGTPLTISGTVTNGGNASAASHSSRIHVCGDGTTSNCNTVQLSAQVATNALSASQSHVISTQHTFSNTGSGYSYRVCADQVTSTVVESNEANNCSAWSSITINPAGAPDLTASTGGVVSGTVGVATTISGTVTNAGNLSAGAHSSVIQICGNGTDASCNTTQANTQLAVGALTASQALPVSTQFTFSTAGTNGYSYRVCADNWSPTITESNEGNNCSSWSYISISNPTITASCSVSPTSQQLNQNVTWTASAGGGNGVYTYSWSGTSPISGTGNPRTVSYSSSGTKTGSVTVTSGGNQTTVACSNSVVISSPPTATLSSNPTIVTTGSASTLTWSSSGATSCTGTGFNTGGATGGSVSTGALSSTQNYQVSCTGPGGTTNDFETVTVIAPTVSITAEPTLVRSGGSTNLKWSAEEVSSCTISANQTGSSFTSNYSPVTPGVNTTVVTNITKQTDYTVSCTTLAGGNISGSVQVNVRFDSDEF